MSAPTPTSEIRYGKVVVIAWQLLASPNDWDALEELIDDQVRFAIAAAVREQRERDAQVVEARAQQLEEQFKAAGMGETQDEELRALAALIRAGSET